MRTAFVAIPGHHRGRSWRHLPIDPFVAPWGASGKIDSDPCSDTYISPPSIQTATPIIIRFSDSDTKPNGTRLLPPTQAHLMSRSSTYTTLNTETAPMPPMNSASGADSQVNAPARISTPASPSAKGYTYEYGTQRWASRS